MREILSEFYSLSEDEYGILFNNATIVFDTNVILDLYRYSANASRQLVEIIDKLKDRVWIPHHVALEFQKKRLTVISKEINDISRKIAQTRESINTLKTDLYKLKVDEYDVEIDLKKISAEIDLVGDKLIGALKIVEKYYGDLTKADTIRDVIDAIFSGRIGPPPSDQAELDVLVADGEHRFEHKIPPGFADIDKGKGPNDSYFIHNGIKYERKFGDLIVWKQILSHVNENDVKMLIFVTSDSKGDWWHQVKGKTIGPHPELVREVRRSQKVELFWMYSLAQFMEHAELYGKSHIPASLIEEINEEGKTKADTFPHSFTEFAPNEYESSFLDKQYSAIINSAHKWLISQYENVVFRYGKFPTFLCMSSNEMHGVEVVDYVEYKNLNLIMSAVEKGRRLISSDRSFSHFTLLIVMHTTVVVEHYHELMDFGKAVYDSVRVFDDRIRVVVGFSTSSEGFPIAFDSRLFS
jgi:predicted nucleic acid-binding protein